MRKFGEDRIIAVTAWFFVSFALAAGNYYRLAVQPPESALQAAADRSGLTVNAGESQGTVYDRNMTRLTNAEYHYVAVAVPSVLDREKTSFTACDRESFLSEFDNGRPFAYECKKGTEEADGLTVFSIPVHYSDPQSAQHVIGYLSEGRGVSGIEAAYDFILRGEGEENSVTYTVDGSGRVLMGNGKEVVRSTKDNTGVVLTLDSRIQALCEESACKIKKGAVIVSEISTGDILAMVSRPDYSWKDVDSAIESDDSPLINRALYSYSVGSVFKLVTAAEGIAEGWENCVYDCKGWENVSGQNFNCHKADGHGIQNMTEAIVNSCNTYFIKLSESLDPGRFRDLAADLGFGRENVLCGGMTASAGVLPTADELLVPAELANFSFGQGKLTATPLQINQLTAAIAGGGYMHRLRLIKGLTADGTDIENEKAPQGTRVLDRDTAGKLREMMICAVRDNKDSKAAARGVHVGAKTSTAQTGRIGRNGEELCHGWITGFYPAESPIYAVTVLAEDGGYGNQAAAPVFREITKGLKKLGSD